MMVSGTVDSPIANRGCPLASTMSTRTPWRAKMAARVEPPIPPPTMITS
ncbi:Uncharacterised protein [Mycobacteroides abscessus subsp. abscessus]|nr:Uncharacterised protein [Mycobacteroides abscessus subsp. abscessus]